MQDERGRGRGRFLPGVAAAAALCEQVRAAGLERPQEKEGFVETVYAPGSRRLLKNNTDMAAEERTELLLAGAAAGPPAGHRLLRNICDPVAPGTGSRDRVLRP